MLGIGLVACGSGDGGDPPEGERDGVDLPAAERWARDLGDDVLLPDRPTCALGDCGLVDGVLNGGASWIHAYPDDVYETGCTDCQLVEKYSWQHDAVSGELTTLRSGYYHGGPDDAPECRVTMRAYVDHVEGYSPGERVLISWYVTGDSCSFTTGAMFRCAIQAGSYGEDGAAEELSLWDLANAPAESSSGIISGLIDDGVAIHLSRCEESDYVEGSPYCLPAP
jgi:hypothetical protein